MTKAIINEKTTVEVDETTEGFTLNGQPYEWDVQHIEGNHFHILKNNRSYNAELIEFDAATKTVKMKINGQTHQVQLKDKTDLMLEKMGLAGGAAAKMNQLKAPMPGLIYDIKVNVGDNVEKGDVLIVLVAMKMENAIKAPGSGRVKEIKTNVNASVEKNQVLITFE